ncbi:MAG: outer membrane protein/peptidoglycan-associated [Desulfobulbaceae bacterium]|nr:MAG: outer membrane protein/peptidoglycan-associated [Desulfobulbaceae bacterium]
MRHKFVWFQVLFCLLASFSWTSNASADATLPTADRTGAKDSPLIGRFAGSFIVAYDMKDYDEFSLPLGPLKPVADKEKRDAHNNIVFAPQESKLLSGRRLHLVYLLPENISPLQATRNYQNEVGSLNGNDGKPLFECKGSDCGGDPGRSSEGGGGDQSLSMYLWPEENIKDKHFTNGHCAQTVRTNEQHFVAFELPAKNAYVSVLAYSVKDNSYCKAFNNRTVVVVDVFERKAMEQKMVTVKAEEMAQSIMASGHIALYGLYFDTGKADVKPESKDTLEQIAKLLTTTPSLKLLVVGHTDNVGTLSSNMDLSKRRADAVVSVLVSQYAIDRTRLSPVGVSFASPVAANSNDEGRAKNRRVELVPNS